MSINNLNLVKYFYNNAILLFNNKNMISVIISCIYPIIFEDLFTYIINTITITNKQFDYIAVFSIE